MRQTPGPGRQRPCVLVFAGSDPSGGAGIQADLQAVAAQGAHALTVVTALTVQDNNRVYSVHPVAPEVVFQQAEALIATVPIAAVKLGIVGSQSNAETIVDIIRRMKLGRPDLPVILDPVLSSGNGDALARGNAVQVLAPLLSLATVVMPNLPEAALLNPHAQTDLQQAQALLNASCQHVLLKGGHGNGDTVINKYLTAADAEHWEAEWSWPRLSGEFHGSGCTLASALAGVLASGKAMAQALDMAQRYCHATLEAGYAIAEGQLIPCRNDETKLHENYPTRLVSGNPQLGRHEKIA